MKQSYEKDNCATLGHTSPTLEHQPRHGHRIEVPVKGGRQTASDSMSDISLESDFESEIGYASCEKDDSPESDEGELRRINKPRKRRQRKYKLNQLRKFEIYSNDSDTTIDNSVKNSRKLRVTKKSASGEIVEQIDAKSMIENALSTKKDLPKDIRRPRNGSKGSWTDSGVSMSKTDSQPSTLGERTQAARIMSRKFGYAENEEARNQTCENSPVDLVRGEIGRRSRSVSEYLKQTKDERQQDCKSAPLQLAKKPERIHEGPCCRNGSNEKAIEDIQNNVESENSAKNEQNTRKQGSLRYPEIIKKDNKGKNTFDEIALKGERKEAEKPLPMLSKLSTNNNVTDYGHFNDKENEIIRQLVQNAKEADRKLSAQSYSSQGTSQGHTEGEGVVIKKSRFKKIKNLLKTRKPKLRSDERKEIGGIKCGPNDNNFYPNFESYFSDDARSRCTDQSCCCCDEMMTKVPDQISHLGRAVPAKKRSLLSRIFKSSSRQNVDLSIENGHVYRVGSQTDTDFGRKRSGSTRSLPDSLKHLWLKALSKSAENVNNRRLPFHYQQNDSCLQSPGFVFKRSRSSCSLFKCQFVPYTPIDMSKSCEALHGSRSPPTPVRRSDSLRSLNIGRNYDIATHVLQARSPTVGTSENNNLFYHPYFEGHAARDDCLNSVINDSASRYCCCESSPAASPLRSLQNGNGCISYHNQPEKPCNSLNASAALARKDCSDLAYPCRAANHFVASENCNHLNVTKQGKSDSTPRYFHDDMTPHHNCHDDDDSMIVAPLQVTITHEKHAEKIRLKTTKNFDTFV